MKPTVYVVDADGKRRTHAASNARALGYMVQTHATAEHFLDTFQGIRPGCLLLDVPLPGDADLRLLERLAAERISLPVVCTSASPELNLAVRAMKAGAVDFLSRPCAGESLASALARAVEIDRHRHAHEQMRAEARNRLEHLTTDERIVLKMVLEGKPGKRIARALDVSPRTVDFRRASVFQKMNANSFYELCQLVTLANLGEAGLDILPDKNGAAKANG
jgi:FixJ family two-component response regulator